MVGLDSASAPLTPDLPFSSPTPPPPACHCGKKGRKGEEMRGENRGQRGGRACSERPLCSRSVTRIASCEACVSLIL